MLRTGFLLAGLLMAAGGEVKFREQVLAEDLKGAYQVAAADLNRDGRLDLIGLAQYTSDLVWFENPGWERHVMAQGLTWPINLDVYFPGDGARPLVVLASSFSMTPAKSEGHIYVLEPGQDVRRPWQMREIDRLPTSHRIRFADLDGSGSKVAVNAPLAGAKAAPPDYNDRAPLVFYRPGQWRRELISDDFDGVLHGIAIVDWDGDGRQEILTASFEGIRLWKLTAAGKWEQTLIGRGNPSPRPKGGSSDVALGRLGSRRFVAAIEPWHGNELAVYREVEGRWQRQVIDDSLAVGHALVTADFDGDGNDEIVAGYREKQGRTYIYTATGADGAGWVRRTLDASMPASSCTAADLDGDGRLDLACVGGSLLKIYLNQGSGG